LLNPPHTAIGSRVPREHLPPLGLLSIGGPLIDDGHDVALLDAEFGPLTLDEIVSRVLDHRPDMVMMGHTGSTTADPTIRRIATMIRRQDDRVRIAYGGVFPTYHWSEVLRQCSAVDYIVRGEGEVTATRLVRALQNETPLRDVPGVAFREAGEPVATAKATMIRELDDYRVGWELIDFSRYSYWGGKRSVVAQFSRGCPHNCTYCGQRGFWTQWRHRDPVKFAAELAWLHREHGVELINFADESPTSSRFAWRRFLEALIAEDVPLLLVGSTRADDIVRDADILHLYKKAGVLRFLMGIENTDEATLADIRKGGSTAKDREAIRLLREHDIISLATWAVGFDEQRDIDFWTTFRQLLSYDADQIMSIYATPHRWTPFYDDAQHRTVIQTDQRLWDYKHQVIKSKWMPPWRIYLWVKLTEAALQLRPKALLRCLFHPDRDVRHGMRWYTRMGRRVWLRELMGFLFRDRRMKAGPTVGEFWGPPLSEGEEALVEIELAPDAAVAPQPIKPESLPLGPPNQAT
jgi:anaerobic magnesium-protoporphyrin IX monomethyl ester cyclase